MSCIVYRKSTVVIPIKFLNTYLNILIVDIKIIKKKIWIEKQIFIFIASCLKYGLPYYNTDFIQYT